MQYRNSEANAIPIPVINEADSQLLRLQNRPATNMNAPNRFNCITS